jgi:hypothetical protein
VDAPPEQPIAALYREMADFAFSGNDPEVLSEKEKLARQAPRHGSGQRLHRSGAQMMLFRLEAEEAIPCAW